MKNPTKPCPVETYLSNHAEDITSWDRAYIREIIAKAAKEEIPTAQAKKILPELTPDQRRDIAWLIDYAVHRAQVGPVNNSMEAIRW